LRAIAKPILFERRLYFLVTLLVIGLVHFRIPIIILQIVSEGDRIKVLFIVCVAYAWLSIILLSFVCFKLNQNPSKVN